jgi:DNA polymerase III subunit delta'
LASDTHSDNGAAVWPRVIGQERVKTLLRRAIHARRLSHAYLFYGPEGSGKDALAIELARVIHCERGGEDACGICPSCTRMDSFQHPDVRFVTALPTGKGETSDDGPLDKLIPADVTAIQEELAAKGHDPYYRVNIPRANTIKINSIREIRREAPLSSSENKRRVYIISNADMMADPAANTLLKTLEEPAGGCLFILTTSFKDQLLPTIVSRCQQVRFDPLTEEQVYDALMARRQPEPAQAELVARLSMGNFTRALQLLDEDLMAERERVLTFIRRTVAGHHADVADVIDAVTERKDRDRVSLFLLLMMMWFRDALVIASGRTAINHDQHESLDKFVTRYPEADLAGIIDDIERAISLVGKNVYLKLVLYQLAGQLKSHILKAT